MKKGSFTAVSTGILLAGHISVRAKKCIEKADVVYCLVANYLAESWLKKINNNVISLQPHYGEGKHRRTSYEGMVEEILSSVEQGLDVCGAFYGHAGVYSWVPHEAIRRVKKAGLYAQMEPGISAEACLYADLGLDPGTSGVQSCEASQLLFFGQSPNIYNYVLLWQIALAGEYTARTFKKDADKINILVQYLLKWYPENHKVILYEAASLPLESPRIDEVCLIELPKQNIELHTTLVIPPAKELEVNEEILRMMGIKEEDLLAR